MAQLLVPKSIATDNLYWLPCGDPGFGGGKFSSGVVDASIFGSKHTSLIFGRFRGDFGFVFTDSNIGVVSVLADSFSVSEVFRTKKACLTLFPF